METPDWITKAQCRGIHGDLWFPPVEHENQQLYYDVAVTVCASCPVWRECLKTSAKETYGMWGGLTPSERSAYVNKTDKHLASHGTFQRFRQGCNCSDCVADQAKQFEKSFKKSRYPFVGKALTDIENVHKRLLNPLDEVK
jgi:hypothetical protein